MEINRKDMATGVIFLGFAGSYGYMSLQTMPVGTATQMGPGYFPAVLSGCLAITGLAVIARSLRGDAETPFGIVPWRAIFCLSAATIAFAALADDLGMLPATFLTSFIACLASPRIGIGQNILTSLCIAGFCSAVFGAALGVPLPLFGELLRQ
jgi:hypothetical protein